MHNQLQAKYIRKLVIFESHNYEQVKRKTFLSLPNFTFFSEMTSHEIKA